MRAAQVEEGHSDAAKVNEDRLVVDQCVGGQRCRRRHPPPRCHLRFVGGYEASLVVGVAFYGRRTVGVRPKLRDAVVGKYCVAEEVVVVRVGVHHNQRKLGLFADCSEDLAAWRGPQPVSMTMRAQSPPQVRC